MHFSFLLSGFSKNSGRKSGFMKIQDINRDIFEIVPNSGRAPKFGTRARIRNVVVSLYL